MKDDHREVLTVLKGIGDCDFPCYGFAPIMRRTGYDRPRVRRACRALARKGYTIYMRGLWTEDGEPAGAGYGITSLGLKALEA